MKKNIIKTCPVCRTAPSRQSLDKCPRCGAKLVLGDLSKMPIEREPEVFSNIQKQNQNNNTVDYTEFFDEKR